MLIAAISAVVGRRYRQINRGIQDGVANMAQSAEQALSAQQEVKVYGAQASELARYTALINRNLGLSIKVESTRAAASSVVQVLAATALALHRLAMAAEAAGLLDQCGVRAGDREFRHVAERVGLPGLGDHHLAAHRHQVSAEFCGNLRRLASGAGAANDHAQFFGGRGDFRRLITSENYT